MNNLEQLKRILEGALLAAGEPLSLDRLAQLFLDSERPDNKTLRATLRQIAKDFEGRGFALKEVASGWRFQVSDELSEWVARLWEEKPARYSRALLETLSLIAYRQPVTRGEIEEVRGVSVSSNIIRTLLEREWVRVVGHRDVPGRPAMYATTKTFLDYFNLKSLDELPVLAEIRDLDKINAELELDGVIDPETMLPKGDVNDETAEDFAALETLEEDAKADLGSPEGNLH
ncbi:MAG: SMC-Scp complex subunit ScpB [Gammaproteobacteria bacterium]|jgi:segregation and condensation protein B|nr:SMC-Scp complex subunit ScpB [Gammaproteobacteria bacterium]